MKSGNLSNSSPKISINPHLEVNYAGLCHIRCKNWLKPDDCTKTVTTKGASYENKSSFSLYRKLLP